jgi:hypothetical protein
VNFEKFVVEVVQMKVAIKFLTLALFLLGIASAFKNDAPSALLAFSISTGIFSLTEANFDWQEKLQKEELLASLSRRHEISWIGKIFQYASFMFLAGYFIFR